MDLIRDGVATVDELSKRLGLTDNAVRAHLATLERDHLIEQHGVQPGTRKPHFSYRLTHEAEELFPKAYQALLSGVLRVLKLRLEPELLNSILRDVAQLLVQDLPATRGDTLNSKAQTAAAVLTELGGTARIEREGDDLIIRSNSGCPFSDVVTEHPEVCRLAESLLREITGLEVTEHCDRSGRPRCTFEIVSDRGADEA